MHSQISEFVTVHRQLVSHLDLLVAVVAAAAAAADFVLKFDLHAEVVAPKQPVDLSPELSLWLATEK